ncbi:hypothetical protein ABMA32_14005 [Mesorhizobium sp. VNQ89]|uniref:hypothetical protein n=1 Tax=Mesorhizobium quangtriensis TaxID=3157709 RepID=UPI0032B7B973
MARRRKRLDPKFAAFALTANKALLDAFRAHGIATSSLAHFDREAGRVVDDIIALMQLAERRCTTA